MNVYSCDTMVALPESTASGQVLFAKNSDRPALEPQPLELHARAEYPFGVKAQPRYIEVLQPPVTYRHVGSRPEWCWGYEHGFNEHQVVIGNEGLPSRLPEAKERRFFGMELVRLALERSRTAAEAVEWITALVERHGQGKFENDIGARTYDNGYLIADPREAYHLETAGRDWALRRITGFGSIGNVIMLGDQAEMVSSGAGALTQRAALQASEPFSFAGTYADLASSAGGIARQRRTEAMLRRRAGRITARTLMEICRDHSGGADPDEPWVEDVAGPVSVCMHVNEGDRHLSTAASLVAELCADGSRLPVYWCCLYSPCMGVYFPVFAEADLPPSLGMAGKAPSPDSPWWLFQRLTADGLQRGSERRAVIRAAWRPLQEEFLESAPRMAARGRELVLQGRPDAARELLTQYVTDCVERVQATARALPA
jgi:dipeptidase